MAEILEVSPRTIANWKRQAREGGPRKVGRPSRSEEQRHIWSEQVRDEWLKQERPGWRPIKRARPEIPTRLMQQEVRKLKVECKRIKRKRIEASRTQVKVNAREAVWALDGTHLERANGKKIEAQVIKDRGTLILLPAHVGGPATGDVVVASLKALRDKRGLPLVLSTDNGSNYVSSAMSDFLKKEKVIHLRSLPRTPQHNGSAENGIRELKEAISYRTETIAKVSTSAILEMSACSLNQGRLRASKDYKTSSHLDDTYPVAYLKVDRALFYERCLQRQLEARAKGRDARAVRMMEREEILRTLEEFELVTIKRGKAQNAKDDGEVIL